MCVRRALKRKKKKHRIIKSNYIVVDKFKVSVSFVKPVLQLFNTSLLEMREEDTDLTKNKDDDAGLPQREIRR